MDKVKWIITIIATCILAYFVYVKIIVKTPEQPNTNKNTELVQVKKRYNKKGKLKSDVELLKGVRHGVANNYYSDGTIHSTIYYNNGEKDGISTWFYQNGKPYRITPFIKGKKQGIQKKYYKTGKLMAEMPYSNNELQPGTKEYSETSKLIKNYPVFNYKVLNNTSNGGTTIIKVTGKKLNKVKYSAFYFHKGKRNDITGKLNDNAIIFHVALINKEIKTLEVTVWITIKTQMNNKKVIEKTLPVEV